MDVRMECNYKQIGCRASPPTAARVDSNDLRHGAPSFNDTSPHLGEFTIQTAGEHVSSRDPHHYVS